MHHTGGLIAGIVLALLLVTPAVAEPDSLTGTASVIDGDTVEIHGTRIRLHGIDAPESRQLCLDADGQPWRCGQKASLALSDRIGRAPITCERSGARDRWQRMIAICRQDGVDLNAWLVAEGWAVAYRQFSRDYVGHEEAAQAAGRGIWAGEFVMPWDWRRGGRVEEH